MVLKGNFNKSVKSTFLCYSMKSFKYGIDGFLEKNHVIFRIFVFYNIYQSSILLPSNL